MGGQRGGSKGNGRAVRVTRRDLMSPTLRQELADVLSKMPAEHGVDLLVDLGVINAGAPSVQQILDRVGERDFGARLRSSAAPSQRPCQSSDRGNTSLSGATGRGGGIRWSASLGRHVYQRSGITLRSMVASPSHLPVQTSARASAIPPETTGSSCAEKASSPMAGLASPSGRQMR